MRCAIFTGLALCILVPAFGQKLAAQDTKPPAAAASAEKLVSIDLTDARFSDAILALAKQGHFNFVADAYLMDYPVKRVQIEAVPLAAAIKKVAELFERKISRVNGVYILSHSRRVLVIGQDEFKKSHYASAWATAGELSIKPITRIQQGIETIEIKPDAMLPSFVSIEANAVSAHSSLSGFPTLPTG